MGSVLSSHFINSNMDNNNTLSTIDSFSGLGKNFSTESEVKPWWTKFIDVLCHLPYPEEDERLCTLIELLRTKYVQNPVALSDFDNFKRNYKSDEAIEWYSAPTVIYKELNEALRQRKMESVVRFGFYIQHMYRQLQRESLNFNRRQINNPVVYRGQFMSCAEIHDLEINWQIIVNSFFSTTLDRDLALRFLGSSLRPDDSNQRVLFEIEIDLPLRRCRPFANISNLSRVPNEKKILFMIGTQFQIVGVSFSHHENIWIAKLKLVDDNYVRDTEDFEDCSPRKVLKNCVNLLHRALSDQSATASTVTTVYDEIKNLFPNEKWISGFYYLSSRHHRRSLHHVTTELVAVMNDHPGLLTDHKEDLSYYEKALKIFLEHMDDIELNLAVQVATIHKHVGCFFQTIKDHKSVMEEFDLAINYYELAIKKSTTEQEKISILSELDDLRYNKLMAINNEDIRIQNTLLSITEKEGIVKNMEEDDSIDTNKLALRSQELGRLYKSVYRYDMALYHYEKALDICYKQFDDCYSLISEISSAIVDMSLYQRRKCTYETARKYQLLKHDFIHRKRLEGKYYRESWRRKQLTESYIRLADIFIALNEYHTAYENLMKASELDEKKSTYLASLKIKLSQQD